MKTKIILSFIFAGLGFIFLSGVNSEHVFAGSCTYVGAGGGTWSTGGNWSAGCSGAGGIPGTNDDITIAANTSTNNDIVGLTLNSITFDGFPSSTQSGNSVTIITAIYTSGPPNPVTINFNVILGGSAQLATNNYSGGVSVNGYTLSAGGGVRPWGITGPLSGTGTILMDSVGASASLNDGGTYTGNIVISGMSQVSIGLGFNNSAVSVINGAILNSSGIVKSITTDGTGTLSPYDGVLVGRIRAVQDITLQSGDSASFRIVSTGTAGQDYDTLQADTVDLGGSTLSLSLDPSYVSSGVDVFTLVSATSGVTGTFNGLPDGSLISVGLEDFIIHYTATTVELQAVGGQIVTDNPFFAAVPATPSAGQSVTITAVIGSNFQIPTGTAEFFDGATSLGTVAISGGNAVITIPGGFTAGSHSITFTYSGDTLHGAFVSNPLVLTVAGLADTGAHLPVGLIAFGLLFVLSGSLLIRKYEK